MPRAAHRPRPRSRALPFTKMHGCGNDYVYLDGFAAGLPRDLGALARAMSDRHTGVGADGLIALQPSRHADCRMAMFNADGSESEMCGNGIRCLAKLAYDRRRVRSPRMAVETGAGVLAVELTLRAGAVVGATVDMGAPRLTPSEVPVILEAPGPLLRLQAEVEGQRIDLLAVGMGNPHAVCFVPDAQRVPLERWGPPLERDPRFPRRVNVEFASLLPDESGMTVVRQRTWERGSGITRACGTGACAVAVAAILSGRIPGRELIVRLDGGDLRIAWPQDGAGVRMSGEAVTVFSGSWERPGRRRR